jgi:uncharacterized protein
MSSGDGYKARRAEPIVSQALGYARIVVINGPRQAGKTTLARSMCLDRGGTFVSLDIEANRRAAVEDPTGFLVQPAPLFIDEAQRAGDPLLLSMKAAVDEDPRPGRFLITGSSKFLTVPTLSESLAGRVDIVDLWPLSQGEIEGTRERFIDRLFEDPTGLRHSRPGEIPRQEYFERICRGGFPAVLDLSAADRRRWFTNYARTVTLREVLNVARPRRAEELPALLRLLAARTAQELNVSALATALEMPRSTLTDYLPLLETVYSFHRLPAWSRNLTSKVVRHPKIHLTDSGLAAHLLGVDAQALMKPTSSATGPLLETFVAGEIARQLTWGSTDARLHHFRDRDGAEVDCVLESSDGRVAAVQVTASASVPSRSLRGLKLLRDKLGSAFVHGVILYTGAMPLPFGDRITALPLAAVWRA